MVNMTKDARVTKNVAWRRDKDRRQWDETARAVVLLRAKLDLPRIDYRKGDR